MQIFQCQCKEVFRVPKGNIDVVICPECGKPSRAVKQWCTYRDCKKHLPSKCSHVLNDNHLKMMRSGVKEYNNIYFFTEAPKCYEKSK